MVILILKGKNSNLNIHFLIFVSCIFVSNTVLSFNPIIDMFLPKQM